MVRRLIIHTYRQAKRAVIVVVGFTVLLIGIVMIALPGPAILIIPAGLAILATEFVWAKRLLHKFKATTDDIIKNPRNARRHLRLAQSKVWQMVSRSFTRKQIGKKPKTDLSL